MGRLKSGGWMLVRSRSQQKRSMHCSQWLVPLTILLATAVSASCPSVFSTKRAINIPSFPLPSLLPQALRHPRLLTNEQPPQIRLQHHREVILLRSLVLRSHCHWHQVL